MSLFLDTLRWFADPAHYQGSDAVQSRIAEHIELSSSALLVAAAIAVPIGPMRRPARRGHRGMAETTPRRSSVRRIPSRDV